MRSILNLMLGALLLASMMCGAARAQEPTRAVWKYSPDLLRPFWQGTVMEGESVLFMRNAKAGEARASVLFPVLQVLAVRSCRGDVTYKEGRDYLWKRGSREFVLPAGSRIVSRTPSELRRPTNSQKYKNLLGRRDGDGEIFFGSSLEYQSMQTCITYTHAPNLWKSAVAKFDPRALPRSVHKLLSKQPLTIVVVGDSISAGCNASGWAGAPPYQPPYPELLQRNLEAHFHDKVNIVNPSVGGTTEQWALNNIDKIIEARPDLVIVAFGMNDDTAGRSAKDYKASIKELIAKVRQRLPDAEFVLVASMLGNPEWSRVRPELFYQYRSALASLCGPGVALADLTSVWTGFLKYKKYYDITGNGVNHPNDFGHRVYAQVISALLIPPHERQDSKLRATRSPASFEHKNRD